jgi:hypothetical protein
LIENETLTKKMSDEGRRSVAQELSWKAKTQEFHVAYENLTEKK